MAVPRERKMSVLYADDAKRKKVGQIMRNNKIEKWLTKERA